MSPKQTGRRGHVSEGAGDMGGVHIRSPRRLAATRLDLKAPAPSSARAVTLPFACWSSASCPSPILVILVSPRIFSMVHPCTTQTSASSSPSAHAPDAPLEVTPRVLLNTCRRCASSMPRVYRCRSRFRFCAVAAAGKDDRKAVRITEWAGLRGRYLFRFSWRSYSSAGTAAGRASALYPPFVPLTCQCLLLHAPPDSCRSPGRLYYDCTLILRRLVSSSDFDCFSSSSPLSITPSSSPVDCAAHC
ncbi:hypothetical protein C8R45DRAFT_1124453 [Mycena sanguinolenta]|nr:hypothetical protein C8R45DRAFT_1124453 [Mycena sanguinolenta]